MSASAPKVDQIDQKGQHQFVADLVLSETKLNTAVTSEEGHIFLLQWLARLEAALKHISDDRTIASAQPELQKSLLRFVCPPNNSPEAAPSTGSPELTLPRCGRPARNLLARCLLLLLQRGDSRSFYDIGRALLNVAGDEGKTKPLEREAKTTALFVLGELFSHLGHTTMSLFVDITTTTQKIAKSATNPVIVRYHALRCLHKTVLAGGRSLSDVAAKEMAKVLKTGLSDRAGAVARGCADCLLALCDMAPFLQTRVDIESTLAAALKDIESADYTTKKSLSGLAAGLLARTQKPSIAVGVQRPRKPGRKKKRLDNESDEEDESSASNQQGASNGDAATAGALLSPRETLDLLVQSYVKPSSSRKYRLAIFDVFAGFFSELGVSWIQDNYAVILKALIDDLPNHSQSTSSRSEILCVRTGINLLLRKVIGERMLGEQAQALAVQEICSNYLKRWPVVMPGQPPPPSKYTLVLALSEVAGLVHQLGTAPVQINDALYDPLFRCLVHPSHSVQVNAAWCLRIASYVHPSRIAATIEFLFSSLQKDLQTLTTSGERGGNEVPRRAVGHARGLAAVISTIPSRPSYASFATSAQVMDMSVQLLKVCGSHSLAISSVEIQVAWILLTALMSLGPNFVRLHLTQLLSLWRGSLPKPETKQTAERSEAEWAFLLHAREATLTCILNFLHHNARETLNLEIARRIVALLSNALAFADGFAVHHPRLSQEQVPGAVRTGLTLLDRELLLRRRLLQCFCAMSGNTALEPLQESLISVAVNLFSQPDRYIGSAAQAAIAASAGTFTTLWSMHDAYAFGVTSLQRDDQTFIADSQTENERDPNAYPYPATNAITRADLFNRDSVEVQIDALQRRPVLGAAEHDHLVLFARYEQPCAHPPLPPPAATGVVDAAIQLFAALLPFQRRQVQIHAFETVLNSCKSNKLDKLPGRRAAIQVNACVASLGALKVAMQGQTGAGGNKPSGFNNDRTTTALRQILSDALLCEDSLLRAVSSNAYGRLAAVAGSHAMSSQVQFLVDQVVSNRDPHARAGCALAFGATYSEVGGLSAAPLTKTVVNVLMSLSSDPHPTVHYAALEALSRVIESASLSYSQYVSSTLGMLVKLVMLDTHEQEGGSAGSTNLRADLPAHQAICRAVSSLIGVLGPDLQDEASKVRDLIRILIYEFAQESDDGVVVEAIKAIQHFCLFAPDQLDLSGWILQLNSHLRSRRRPRKLAAINGLYQLIQRQALLISKVGGDSLVADLFTQLDLEPSMDGVREILSSWLRQTAHLSPGSWIDVCQRILDRKVSSASKQDKDVTQSRGIVFQDEEAATLDVGDDAGTDAAALQGCRWRTQLFALECLDQMFGVVRQSGRLEHFVGKPRQSHSATVQDRTLMSNRIVDLIKMAFTASTAPQSEMKLKGLKLLEDVIQNFKEAKDPDFSEAYLLEQHQAPMAAALMPAFLADSTPEVLAAAIRVCAVFVGSGVVREVDRMGRILKQLESALENCMDAEMTSLGDVKDLSPNATAMLKVAVFTAWADLVIASPQQAYLVEVVKPRIASLAPYWIACLREYASIKADPQGANIGLGFAMSSVVVNPSLDSHYAGLARSVLASQYQAVWQKILQALTVLMESGHPAVPHAMDGETHTSEIAHDVKVSSPFRSEPTLMFPVLYGMAIEALAVGGEAYAPAAGLQASRPGDNAMISALRAVKFLSLPQYAGSALLQEGHFDELYDICLRVALTENAAVQGAVVDLVATFAAQYRERLLDSEEGSPIPSQKGCKLHRLLRIVVLIIKQCRRRQGPLSARASLLRSAFSTYTRMVEAFDVDTRDDLLTVAWYLYSEILRDEHVESELVAISLGIIRDLGDSHRRTLPDRSENLTRTVHGFLSLAVNTIDELRARSGSTTAGRTQNCLLAASIVLTSFSEQLTLSRPVVEHVCYLLSQRFSSSDHGIALTAIRCATMLMQASTEGAPALLFCAGQLLPSLVECCITSNLPKEDEAVRLQMITEKFKALEATCSATAAPGQARVLCILLPALLYHVDVEQDVPSQVHTAAVSRLLSLATHFPAAFKDTTAILDDSTRSKLETSIRQLLGSRGRNGASAQGLGATPGVRGSGEASIALKSFGAS